MNPRETQLRQKLLFVFGAAICLGIGGIIPCIDSERTELGACWSLLGTLVSIAPIAADFIADLRARSDGESKSHVDLLILIAVLACMVTGQLIVGGLVGIVLTAGHILEDRSLLGSNQAIEELLRLSRTRARRISPSEAEEEIDANLLQEDDLLRVRPGDVIPADGVVVSGRSSVNQANITGESLPVEAAQGSPVFAGTANLTGLLEVRVTKAGNGTVLGQVRQIVEEAQATRAPIMRLTEQYAHYYMPLVLLISGFVLFFTRDVQRAVSVLIVSVPCAFLLAGPTAMVAALASASRLGILVKSVRFFEAASRVDAVVFDKTGTLTTGRLRVEEVAPACGTPPATVLGLAAAIESHSTHPVARAIVERARETQPALPEAAAVAEQHGQGMSGTVNGKEVLAGRKSWLIEKGIRMPFGESAEDLSAVHIAAGGQYLGAVYLADALRPEAPALKRQLESLGVERLIMLTGDRRNVARSIAEQIGFTEYEAQCLPPQKRDAVERLKTEGRTVLVVGDGVNDAPALAAADLSVAMGALGSDVAIQTADIALMSSELHLVPQFIRLSRQTLRTINRNMLFGALFVAGSIVLSGAGCVTPLAASIIHELGAFFVVMNSARLLAFGGEIDPATSGQNPLTGLDAAPDSGAEAIHRKPATAR